MRALSATESRSGQSHPPNEPPFPDEGRSQDAAAAVVIGGAGVGGSLSPARLRVVRRIAISLWLAFVIGWTFTAGLAIDYSRLFIMVCTGLIAASIGRQRAISVVRDWLPFLLVLFLYDLSRGTAALLGRPTEWYLQIRFDRWMFGGTDPTVWLQAKLKAPFAPWWEVIVSVVYISYFIAPYALAGVLWLRSRADWRKFVFRFVTMAFIGLACFIVFPAAPPWAASQCTPTEVVGGPADPGCLYVKPGSAAGGGLLGSRSDYQTDAAPWVERISNRGWLKLGLPQASALIDEGQAGVNQVAAVPSLHAATTALIAIFLWPRVRKRWRPLVVAYPLVMAFALVYGAEHYVFDILLGWVLAGAVSACYSVGEARRARRRIRTGSRRRPRGSPTLVGGGDNPTGHPDILEEPLLNRP